MKSLSDEVYGFFRKQHFVIVATIDSSNGNPHTSCKGIVKIERCGRIYLMDLYKWRTYNNLIKDKRMSVTAVDEHRFKGWCLKGTGRILPSSGLTPDLIKAWENKISSRITHRIIKNIREEKGHGRHPESQLPAPEYVIEMEAESLVDLMPHHVSGGADR